MTGPRYLAFFKGGWVQGYFNFYAGFREGDKAYLVLGGCWGPIRVSLFECKKDINIDSMPK
jgi:hypothetical protein